MNGFPGAPTIPVSQSVREPHSALRHSPAGLYGFGRPSPAYSLLSRDGRPHIGVWLPWASAFAAVLAAFVLAPAVAVPTAVSVILTLYVLFAAFRSWMVTLGRFLMKRRPEADPPPLADGKLPSYTILVPLYREHEVVAMLIRHLTRLDYPADRLEILLLCEPDDAATIAAVSSLRLDGRFRLVISPPAGPRTKPRACNVGLLQATGQLCVIYDAEDRPALDQLRRAAAHFSSCPDTVVCLQARLDYHNHAHNALTRCFTVEYNYWFDLLLPGLAVLDLPIPLGGTSNHFRTEALRELGGWDPYNVTEDADLGVRLHLVGGRTRLLDSVTLEEACAQPTAWIRQRTRWMKGYLQTWLVHTRRPGAWTARRTTRWAIHAFIGGIPLANLFAPVLLVAAALTVAKRTGGLLPSALEAGLVAVVIAVNFMTVYAGLLTVVHRRRWHLLGAAFAMPLYSLLASVATYRAVWQLFTRPHLWEKTPHGLSGDRTDPARADDDPPGPGASSGRTERLRPEEMSCRKRSGA